jgi:two-component system response regulator MprA
MRILFVDDLKDARDLFRIAFSMQGHTVELASNGAEAVAAVQNSEPFDVIVMDVEMPEMNGWDAVRAIRSLPGGRKLPIVMFTAYGNGITLKLAREVGADDVLHKPLSPYELLARVQQLAA